MHKAGNKVQENITEKNITDFGMCYYVWYDTAGDNAIIEIAKTLTECFVYAECYRIGGDEFCIISEGVQEEQIKEFCEKVQDELTVKSKKLDYDITTAMGYSKVAQGNIDECFNKADALMYENKKQLKGV